MLPVSAHTFPLLTKTRIAPTPSGYLHLGNVYSFVLTLALAKRTGAGLLLRIDDMDRNRAAKHFIQDIFDTLHFLEIPWDEGPLDAAHFEACYAQQHRLPLYNAALQKLIEGGKVFACTCSRTDSLKRSSDGGYPGTCRHKNLPLDTTGCALRIKTPAATQILLRTFTGDQQVQALPPSVRDFVVRKKDGLLAYQLCSLVDDLHVGIDLVVRGEDLWASTLAQCWLSSLLLPNNFKETVFVHHRLLTTTGGVKLSKSAGDTSVYGLRKQGLSKEEVFAVLGKMIGLKDRVENWQMMAGALL